MSATDGQSRTVLGQGCVFEGKMKSSGEVRIDGKFSGEISGVDTITIASSAHVSAAISAGKVIVEGKVEGKIHATEVIELRSPCRAQCDLEAPSLSIANGVLFDGNCKMGGGNEKAKAPVPMVANR
jgi:cytoskeletal protein CcmA (bactofilin family)